MEWTKEAIKALREKMELNQLDFAARLGMTRQASVSELENGKSKPNPQTRMLLDMLYKEKYGGEQLDLIDQQKQAA